GLTKAEYNMIKKLLKREPNYTELGMFSAMWSEHCSYKNSKKVLKLLPTSGKHVLQGPGENSGVVDMGDGIGVAIKIESHNHPSAIEPYQAAATGGGGCLRDIFTMGARPLALLGSIRLGELLKSRTRFLLKNISKGFVDYANKVDIPVVGGEIYFDQSYEGNPLVNAFTVGVLKHKDIIKARAKGKNSLVVIIGRATGRDGVEGAAMASAGLTEDVSKKSSAVAIGDPKMGKALREACLELISKGLVIGMQDMGAAGLTCSTSEIAYKSGLGMEIDLAYVPRSEDKMTPYEIMLSESQERMLVIIKPKNLRAAEIILNKWKVPSSVIGKVIPEKTLRIKEADKIVAEIPPVALVEAPVYSRKYKKPVYLKSVNRFKSPAIKPPKDFNNTLLKILNSATVRSKRSLYKMSRTSSGYVEVGPGSDSAVLSIPGTRKKLAITVDGNSSYCFLDPYRGGQIAVAEAARNLAASGALPLGITDGLNFGNPYNEGVYWQFRQSVLGITKAARSLGIPVVSGNVSFNNENPHGSVDPTPIIGMVGVIKEGSKPLTQSFKSAKDAIILLGKNKEELGGSEYLKVMYNKKAGKCPAIDLDLEKSLHSLVLALAEKKLLLSAHDCSEGGLAVALAESCLSDKHIGALISLDSSISDAGLLFSETQSRMVVSCNSRNVSRIEAMAKENRVPYQVIGVVGGNRLTISNNNKILINTKLAEMSKSWQEDFEL
ncbi:MAG TPA: phosphoribosylformylglycinamidine synthase subunit PurL, partial [Candidatus Omnitrophica bacterium]|nr:phosphoribosylformylglycinamidine synthase subunit PurL [Candidatus Omnitrophota bacterium]